MKREASLYFTSRGYTICGADGSPTSLMTIDDTDLNVEAKLRRAWYYLGRGMRDALDDSIEFITLISDTKVIDQLNGVIIDDEDCLMMARSIRARGLPQFLHYTCKKVTTQIISEEFDKARRALRG